MTPEHLDVLIIGAGLSGIGAAYHLQDRCPAKTYAVLEARGDLGGTWDLFRYPGVRSDSDMHTLGYGFRPWTGDRAIADGPAILQYLRQPARRPSPTPRCTTETAVGSPRIQRRCRRPERATTERREDVGSPWWGTPRSANGCQPFS